MVKNYGWAEMPVMGYIEGSTNVRPIIQRCHDENKSGILHYVTSERKSACGSCIFRTSFLDINNRSVLVKDPTVVTFENEKILKSCLVCPDCLETTQWKDYKEGRERETDGNK